MSLYLEVNAYSELSLLSILREADLLRQQHKGTKAYFEVTGSVNMSAQRRVLEYHHLQTLSVVTSTSPGHRLTLAHQDQLFLKGTAFFVQQLNRVC